MLMEHPLDEKSVPFHKPVYPGQEFKNYPALCQYLGIEVKKGKNPKEHQLKELRRHFDFHKAPDSQKLVIDEVFDAPKQKPMRASNSPMKDADKVLYSKAKNGKFDTPHTYTHIAIGIGLISPEFWGCYRYPEHIAEHLDVSLKCMEAVSDDISSTLNSFIERLLRRMEKESWISVKTGMFSKVHERADNGTEFYGVREATTSEIDLNNKCTKVALDLVECTSINEVHKRKRARWYYRERGKIFQRYSEDLGYDLEYVYRASKIYATGDMDLSGVDIEEVCDKLRDIFFDACFSHKHPGTLSEIDRAYLLNYLILRNSLRKKRDFELAAWELFGDKYTDTSLASRIKAYCTNLLLKEAP